MPRLLDLFCGAGGAAVGYARAGFDVVGVDVVEQPNYPFEFVQADALRVELDGFDAVHASPPCQHFTAYRRVVKDITERYEDRLDDTRARLRASGLPYVIENVEGAPLLEPVLLCGSMFELDVRRHRLFEPGGGFTLEPPLWPCRHKIWAPRFKPASNRTRLRSTIEVGSWDEPIERQRRAMGIDWPLTVRELSEAVPPAYTEYVGGVLLAALEVGE